MPTELKDLLDAVKALPAMTRDQREEQARNFVVGNVGLENPRVTRAVVDEAMRLKAAVDSR